VKFRIFSLEFSVIKLSEATKLLLFTEANSMVTINADKKRKFTVSPVDARGRVARIDGIPEWSVTPQGGVSLFPSADGLSCDVIWLAPLAGQVLTVKADADLGSGVKEITGTADIETLGTEAASFQMTVGEEEDNT
jgi:hypothetical protein